MEWEARTVLVGDPVARRARCVRAARSLRSRGGESFGPERMVLSQVSAPVQTPREPTPAYLVRSAPANPAQVFRTRERGLETSLKPPPRLDRHRNHEHDESCPSSRFLSRRGAYRCRLDAPPGLAPVARPTPQPNGRGVRTAPGMDRHEASPDHRSTYLGVPLASGSR